MRLLQTGRYDQTLGQLTLLPVDEIAAIMATHSEEPHLRRAQQALADAVTELVHGSEAVEGANLAAEIMFGKAEPTPEALESIVGIAPTESYTLGDQDEPLVEILVRSELAASKTEARKAIASGAVKWNGEKIDSPDQSAFLEVVGRDARRIGIVQKGKRNKRLMILE